LRIELYKSNIYSSIFNTHNHFVHLFFHINLGKPYQKVKEYNAIYTIEYQIYTNLI